MSCVLRNVLLWCSKADRASKVTSQKYSVTVTSPSSCEHFAHHLSSGFFSTEGTSCIFTRILRLPLPSCIFPLSPWAFFFFARLHESFYNVFEMKGEGKRHCDFIKELSTWSNHHFPFLRLDSQRLACFILSHTSNRFQYIATDDCLNLILFRAV